jgi:hypothetical protein
MLKLGTFAETSMFDPEKSYEPPHDDTQPAQFGFEKFVADPAVYAPKSPRPKQRLAGQILNTVISQMSARLSINGARKDTFGLKEDEL